MADLSQAQIEMLNKAIVFAKGLETVKSVELCGSWLWVVAPADDSRLKAFGFKYGKRRGKWYFAGAPRIGRKHVDFQRIRKFFGSSVLVGQEDQAVTA